MHLNAIARTLIVLVVAAVATGCGRNARDEDQPPAEGAAQLYEQAARQMKIGGYERAVGLLERLELFYPFSEYTRRGQLDLIYAYHRNGDTESAIDAANEFIRENPIHPDVDYAHYLRGLIFFERDRNPIEKIFRVDLTERPPSDAERSLSYFTELERRYPESKYTADAQQRMIYLRERLAKYDLHVARYYMSRRAWLGAVSRARNVVENYQDTHEVGEALTIMARAYRKLGMDDLAADAERVLEENALAGSSSKRRKGLFNRDRRAVPERPASGS